ncbi:hypothetical protein B1748_30150 [Paenibacillus sp. MY03]|uniref:hypothetical protein n=1 Tax=Paenibacillus sp. MY03 TaxID=302980 RepID=UPI000B3C015E|nr:hypothetical protein [Paenibacillus sp. MY03]OUS69772.1 hypothetical protein B1748_30150 [Paenibacillus sp. MY03]
MGILQFPSSGGEGTIKRPVNVHPIYTPEVGKAASMFNDGTLAAARLGNDFRNNTYPPTTVAPAGWTDTVYYVYGTVVLSGWSVVVWGSQSTGVSVVSFTHNTANGQTTLGHNAILNATHYVKPTQTDNSYVFKTSETDCLLVLRSYAGTTITAWQLRVNAATGAITTQGPYTVGSTSTEYAVTPLESNKFLLASVTGTTLTARVLNAAGWGLVSATQYTFTIPVATHKLGMAMYTEGTTNRVGIFTGTSTAVGYYYFVASVTMSTNAVAFSTASAVLTSPGNVAYGVIGAIQVADNRLLVVFGCAYGSWQLGGIMYSFSGTTGTAGNSVSLDSNPNSYSSSGFKSYKASNGKVYAVTRQQLSNDPNYTASYPAIEANPDGTLRRITSPNYSSSSGGSYSRTEPYGYMLFAEHGGDLYFIVGATAESSSGLRATGKLRLTPGGNFTEITETTNQGIMNPLYTLLVPSGSFPSTVIPVVNEAKGTIAVFNSYGASTQIGNRQTLVQNIDLVGYLTQTSLSNNVAIYSGDNMATFAGVAKGTFVPGVEYNLGQLGGSGTTPAGVAISPTEFLLYRPVKDSE